MRKIKELLKLDKKSFLFFCIGCILALSIEQQGWWSMLLFKQGEFHNDWWMIISENIKIWKEGGTLNALYTTEYSSGLKSYYIWTAAMIVSLLVLLLSVAILIYKKVKK